MPPAPKATDSMMFLMPAGLALVMVIFGAIMAAVGNYRAKRDEASRTWPTVEAVITRSGRSSYKQPGESTAQSSSYVSYRYEVRGQTYEFTSSPTGEEMPKQGAVVRLRYDPEDPSDTRVPNQPLFPATGFYLVGLGAALITLPFWYLAWRWYRADT